MARATMAFGCRRGRSCLSQGKALIDVSFFTFVVSDVWIPMVGGYGVDLE